jgi:hypothetical protein
MNNVSSLVPSNINQTLSRIQLPSAFGSQLLDSAKQKIKQSALGPLEELKQKTEVIIKKQADLEVKHKVTLLKLDTQYKPIPPVEPSLSEDEYKLSVATENTRYQTEKDILQLELDNNNKQIQSLIKDPTLSYKTTKTKNKLKLQRQQAKNKANNTKAATALFTNISKALGPILLYSSSQLISKLIIQNIKLQELVDQTNEIIDNAVTPDQLSQATVSRNSAYSVINNNEQLFINIKNIISTIQIIVTIVEILVPLLFLLPVPPLPLIKQLGEKLAIVNIVLIAILGILDPPISVLEDLKNQLRDIDKKLDLQTLSYPTLTSLINLTNSKPTVEEYKGFKLAIKEDNDPKFIVRGNKRRYGAAIDKDGVEAIKSEYSYTLDPQILIDQLKIIINQRNPQT